MAAAAKEQAKAKAKKVAAAKVEAKAKAKASEKEERCLLAEAIKAAARAAKAAAAAELVEAAESRAVKPEREPAREQDGATKAAKSEAAKPEAATATAEATKAEAAHPLVQARAGPLPDPSHMQPRTRHTATYLSCCHGHALLTTGASGAEEGPDYHGRRQSTAALWCPA